MNHKVLLSSLSYQRVIINNIKMAQSKLNKEAFNNKFIKMMEYKRNHPFYQDWNDWQSIVYTYHSQATKDLQKYINEGYRNYHTDQVSYADGCMIDEIYFSCNRFVDAMKFEKNMQLVYDDYDYTIDFTSYNVCTCTDEQPNPFDNHCHFAEYHLRAHILSFMWAFVYKVKPKKHLRRYYRRLERIVLSLPYKYLLNFDKTLILDPPNYKGRGRCLLKELYERAYFDQVDVNKMTQSFEYYKHFVKSQGGNITSQSHSDISILKGNAEEMLQEFAEKLTFDQFMSLLIPKSQGLQDFCKRVVDGSNLNMTHSIDDSSIDKLKNMIADSQKSFFDGMKDTVLSSGKTLFAMFASTVTIYFLSKAAVNLGFNIIMKMLHMVYALISGTEDFSDINKSYIAVSQMGEMESIPFIPTMILNYIISPPKDILSRIWKSGQTDLIMRRIGYLGDIKVEKGIDRIIDWMKGVVQKVQQWYGIDVLGIHCGLKGFFDKEESPLTTWFKEVDDLVESYYKEEFKWTELEYNIIYNLYKQGLSCVRNQEFSKYKNDIYKVLQKLTNIMEKFKQHGISSQHIRNPPVTIYLYGGTGVGKSSITYPLAVEILKGIHDREGSSFDLKKNWKNMIYMRAPEQEYWDGYENQLVTVFDDYSQQIDSAQNPNVELFEIIRASNCFPYPLHMASIDQKANTVFTSKIIIVSSNMHQPQCASLNFPDALKRRFDICVNVEREYKGHTNKFDPLAYKLTNYNMVTGQKGKMLDYKDLVDSCVDAYFGRKNFVNTVEDYINTLFVSDDEEEVDFKNTTLVVSQGNQLEEERYYDANDLSYSYNEHPGHIVSRVINTFNPYGCEYEIVSEMSNPFKDLRDIMYKIKPSFKDIQQKWIEFKNKHKYLSTALMLVGVMSAGFMVLKIFQSFKNVIKPKKEKIMTDYEFVNGLRTTRSERTAVAEAYTSVKQQVAKVEGYSATKVAIPKTEAYTAVKTAMAKFEGVAESEGVKDINAAEVLMKVARSNMYKMYESTQGAAIGHVFFLRGKICIMPKHYLSGLYQALRNDKNASVYFEAVLLNRSFEIKIKDMLDSVKMYESPSEEEGPVMTRDLMACVVESSIVHVDACQHFTTKSSVSRTDCTEVMLPVLVKNNIKNSDRSILIIRYAQGRSQLSQVENLPVSDKDNIVSRYIREAWMYNLDTKETECGAPLIVRNTQIQTGKICGIHIAGISGTGQGWSTPVYIEDVLKIVKMFPQDKQYVQQMRLKLEEFPVEQGQVPQDAEFIRHGALKTPLAQPTKTKIQPSPIYSKIKEPETRPCLLRAVEKDGEIFDPRVYRLNKLGNITKPIDIKLLNNSKEALIDEISTVFDKTKDILNDNIKAKYTFEEACCGIEGEDYVNSIKRDTSSGFPFVQFNKFTRKDIFGNEMEYNLETEQCKFLKQRVDEIIEKAKKGIVLDHYFIDTLKDERKPLEKYWKTRLFSAGPIDYLIACKMYFNGVVAMLSKTRNYSHVSVGTNVYSQDWTEIVKCLHRKSEKLIAGDFEGFDASQQQQMLEASGEVLIELSRRFLKSTEEDIQVMRVLMVSLINSFHITGKEVYQWTHSLPSGHYLTAIINSIFVNISMGCIWQLAMDEISYIRAREFWEQCGIVAYGDDHIVSVPLSKIDKFNQMNIPKYMSMIGLSYTMEDKDRVANVKYRSIDEVSYLKRGFLFDKKLNRYLSPLSLSTVLEFPMWVHKCPDPIQQTKVELEKCIQELSLHPSEVWARWLPVLKDVGSSIGYYTKYVNQDETRLVAISLIDNI